MNEYQSLVDRWIKSHGVRYFDEKTNTLLLVEEVGEFARIVARIFGEQSFKNDEQRNQAANDIKDELADILFVIACLANQMDIKLDEILMKNLEKKTKRDRQRHRNNPKLL